MVLVAFENDVWKDGQKLKRVFDEELMPVIVEALSSPTRDVISHFR